MRSLLPQSVITLVLVCVASVATVATAESHPFKTTLTGDHDRLAKLAHTTAKGGARFPLIHFNSKQIFGVGSARFVFNARKLPAAEAVFVSGGRSIKDLTVPTLMKGYVLLNRTSGIGNRVPAALSVIKGAVRIQFSTGHSAKQAKAPRLYAVTWRLSSARSAQARVSTKQNSALLNKLCDTHAASHGKAHSLLATGATAAPAKTTTLARVVTLSTDADPEWYKVYGDASNAEIAAVVNAAEAIFERQLGLRFALVRQHVYVGTSPYVSTDASALLGSFAKNPENPANLGFSPLTFDQDVDIKHLFTGKDLIGNVIGLSYVGAICWSPKNAYGLTQNITRELNITTFLHEVGHTLGAGHDTNDVGGIMYPNLGIKRYFSAVSVEQMNRTLAAHNKCVSEEMVGANLANATLTLKQKRSKDKRAVVLSGKLVSNLAMPLPGEVVKLTLNKRVVFAMTDVDGAFTYRIRLSNLKVKQLKVFAQTVNNETSIPNALKVQVRV
jgi:hypothetical protein